MTERKQATTRRTSASQEAKDVRAVARDNEESERALGRMVAIGLPIASVVAAGVVGFIAGLGSALLVVAAAALLGTISLLWASVRTLSGDAPLSNDIEEVAARRVGVDALGEQKRRVLRALKDLEADHSLGKIEDADYAELVARYRNEAKAVLREMDLQVAPLRDEAEKIARAYLAKRGLGEAGGEGTPAGDARDRSADGEGDEPSEGTDVRVKCAHCGVSNEADAAFCKKCGTAVTRTAQTAEASDADA